jgi:hypothetical protein
MTTALVLTLFASVAGALTWLHLLQRARRRERQFERRVQARKLGWSYVDERDGRIDYRFAGASEGLAWQMWYDSDRGEKSPTPRACWLSANVRTSSLSLVILGRRRFGFESGMVGQVLLGVVGGIAQAMTGRGDGPDKSSFYGAAIDLQAGRPLFRERFAIAVSPDMPRDWVDDELQALLLRWPSAGGTAFRSEDGVEVNLGADGLRIVAQRMPEEFVCWQHLARLCEHLARNLIAAKG